MKAKEYPDPKNAISYSFAVSREEWLRTVLLFRKLTDFGRGIMYSILKDAYSFDERCAQCRDRNWRGTDDFFFDHPQIADNYGFITCFRGEPVGFICRDPRFVLYDRKENPGETAFAGDDLYYRMRLNEKE